MRAAVVDLSTNVVINIIVADADKDLAPDGCILVNVADILCDMGWIYNADTGVFAPVAEPVV